jgi:transglutaminase-like putative cysteine protease
MPKVIDSLRSINMTREPEDSIPFRVAVLVCVLLGALALAAEGAVAPSSAVLLMAALPFAYWVSYRRRAKDNWHIKIALTLAALFALSRFLGQLSGLVTLDEVRFPLADLFLWVQVIHGFDLPQRKDLHFSLGSSLALVAVAGSLSQDLRFLPFLALYAVAAVVALYLGHRSSLEDDVVGELAPVSETATGVLPHARRAGRGLAGTVAAGVVLFLIIPQPQGVRSFALPFSLGGTGGIFAGQGVINPGFSGAASQRSGGSSFHGFGSRMDLRVRGDLPDDLVLRVRSTSPAMWKGAVFDTYDGAAWIGEEGEGEPLGGRLPAGYPAQHRSGGPRTSVTQTFYVEAELPNAVFAAEFPDQIWYDGSLRVDELGGLRTDSTLTEGGVYSVISSRGAATSEELRSAGRVDAPHLERYLQLPDTLPERVRDLALRVTAAAETDYDKVRAIEDYLERNFRYRIDSPIPPIGRDAVDHFLFETDVGFCEQFAAATAVMLRSLGIPARVVAGYTTGDKNLFTGLYEVKASDAHSWVEVWFPRFGWYEFDPTYDIPPATYELADTLPLARLLRTLGSFAALIAGGSTGFLTPMFLVLVLATLVVGVVMARRRWKPRKALDPAVPAGRLGQAFHEVERALESSGAPRVSAETARETLFRAARLAGASLRGAPAAIEKELYGAQPVSPEDEREAVMELDQLAGVLSQHADPG